MAQTILVTFDLSTFGEHVLEVAVPEAQATGAQMHLFHVLSPAHETASVGPHFDPTGEGQVAALAHRQPQYQIRQHESSTQASEREQHTALDYLNGLVTRFPAGCAVAEVGVSSHAAREIIAHAEKIGADKIVMATHGRSALAHVVLGSVASEVVRSSPIPVLLKRPSAMPPHPDSGA